MSEAPINIGGELARLNSLLRAMEHLCEPIADAAAMDKQAYAALTALEACIECADTSLKLLTTGFEAMEADGGDARHA